MEYKNYLMTDFGASNGRVVVARYNGKRFDLEEVHRFANEPVNVGGSLYWDFLHLYAELKAGIQAAVGRYARIDALGIDSWGIDFGFIDRNGKLLANPYCYRDENRWAAARELFQVMPERELYRLVGGITLPVAGIYQMFHLARTQGTELRNAHRFLMITDLFNYFLTGRACNEFTAATITLMFEQRERKWESRILDMLGIPRDIFPEMLMPGTRIGPLQRGVCSELGIGSIQVVAPCTHDTPGAVAGIPVASNSERWCFLPIGTWCVSGVETTDLIIKDEGLRAGYYNEGGAYGVNLFVRNITGLWLIQQCRSRWREDLGRELPWEEIVHLAEVSAPFKAFLNVDDPAFAQPQADMPAVVREYLKGRKQNPPSDIGGIARCIFESLALRFKHDFLTLEKLTGTRFDVLYLIGGGIRNRLLCQFAANATGMLCRTGLAESSTIGNLIMQLQATGEISSLDEGRRLIAASIETETYEPTETGMWDAQYARYQELLQ
jgi:rhamnulokinase